ncbi:MAG: hypothetical protein ACK5P2_15490 [Pseudanabaena sp.]
MARTKTKPLKRAYIEAKILALTFGNGLIGPMPLRIIEASTKASTQLKPATQ